MLGLIVFMFGFDGWLVSVVFAGGCKCCVVGFDALGFGSGLRRLCFGLAKLQFTLKWLGVCYAGLVVVCLWF